MNERLPSAIFRHGNTEIIFRSEPELVTIQSIGGRYPRYIHPEELVQKFNERHEEHPFFKLFCECEEAVAHLALKYGRLMKF